MGIPQGSATAQIPFNILIQYLLKWLSKNVILVKYADAICMWMNVTTKRKTPARNLNYIKKLYQNELDRLNSYMFENGLTLSTEKTSMVLFSSGCDSAKCPSFMTWS